MPVIFLLLVLTIAPFNAFSAEPLSPDSVITVSAVGDIMMGSTWPEPKLPPDDGAGIFDAVKPHFLNHDIVFGNLEGPLFDGEADAKCRDLTRTCYAFKTPTRYARYLLDAGFTALGIANNHASDFGTAGRDSTIRTLQAAGIKPVGGMAEASFLVRGTRVAIAGFSYSDNPYSHSILNVREARAVVRRLKARHDLVIVSFHGGAEGRGALHVPDGRETFLGEERGNVKAFARGVVDAGADLVLGHGPHVVRALEIYKGKLIAYSLGNFLAYERFNLDGASGRSFILSVSMDAGTGMFLSGSLVPVRLVREGIPEPDPDTSAVSLARRLTKQDLPDSGLLIAKDGGLEIRPTKTRSAKRKKAPAVPAVAQTQEAAASSSPPSQQTITETR